MIPILFALIGAFALAAQTILLREYLVLHGGNELSVGLFYASWFGWIGLAATAARFTQRGTENDDARGGAPAKPDRLAQRPERRFGALLALYPVALIAQILLIRATRSLAGVPPTEPFAFGSLALWTLLTNAPVGVITGLVFPLGCAVARRARPALDPDVTVSRAYVFESLGSFAGGVLVTALLGTFVPAIEIGLGAALALAVGAAVWALQRRARPLALVHGLWIATALIALAGSWGAALSTSSVRSRFAAWLPQAELVAATETPYQHVAVARLGEQVLLVSNGRIASALPDEAHHAMRAALLMSQPATPKRVLLIGSGAQGMVRALLAYPLERLSYVEPDERAHRLLEPYLPAPDRQAFEDPRLELVFTDGRLYLNEQARGAARRFDLVLLDLPDPDTAALNRYFTVEAYQAAQAVLAPGGVLATRITSGDNVLGTELASYGASVLQTLRSVFAEVAVSPGEESWLLASCTPGQVSVDATELERRYGALALDERAFPAEGFRSLLDPERAAFTLDAYQARALEDPAGLLNTDDHPVTFFLNLLVLGRHTGSAAVTALRALRDAGSVVFLVPLLVFVVLRLHYTTLIRPSLQVRRFDATLLASSVGFASIALQIILLFAFQSRFGLLFEQIGLVSALFMAGLAMGALGVERLGRRAASRGEAALRPSGFVVTLLLAEALALPWLLATLSPALPHHARAAYYALFLLTGVLSGAAFPWAARLSAPLGPSASRIAATLQAADHWGAAWGAALAGALMVPVLGLQTSCGVLAALLGACALLLFGSPRTTRARLARALRWLGLLRAPAAPKGRRKVLSFSWIELSYWLAGVAVCAALTSALVRRAADRPVVRLEPQRLAHAIEATRFEEREEPFWHYRAYAEGADEFHAVALSSFAVTGQIMGYGGPLNLLVALDREGTIERVDLLGSEETPAYTQDLARWLDRFEGKRATGRFRLAAPARASPASDYEIDVISGATVTSRAALQTVNAATHAAASQLLGLQVEPAAAGDEPSPWSAEVWLLLAALVLAIPVLLRAPAWLRTAFLGLNLLLLGLLDNVQLSLEHVVQLSALDWPSPSQPLLFVLVSGVLALGLCFGPAYCGVLCPFGASQELIFGGPQALVAQQNAEGPSSAAAGACRALWSRRARAAMALALAGLLVDRAAPSLLPDVPSRLGRDLMLAVPLLAAFALLRWRMGHQQGRLTHRLHGRLRYLKYLLLAAVIIGWALSGSERALAFDPLAQVFSGSYRWWPFLLLATLWLLCLYYLRFWCRFFCPVGALLHLFNKAGVLLGLARSKSYRRCDLGVRSAQDIDCIQCNRCVTATAGRRDLCAARPSGSEGRSGSSTLLLWAVSVVGALVVAQVLFFHRAASSSAPLAPRHGVGSTVRDVDAEQIRRLIQQGRLSDHEAEHYRKLPADALPRGAPTSTPGP